MDCSRVVYDSNDSDVVTSVQNKTQKSVILTFDDGPSKVLTQILDVLKAENVPAVFFWQSRLLYPKRPWNRVLDEGHLIGSHTTKHPNMTKLTYEQQYKEIQNSITKIEQITGSQINYFRPPFGQYNDDTIKAAKQLNVLTVMWRIAAIDWELKEDPQQIITNVADNLEDGAVILLHELKQTLEVLPELIKAIRNKGYSFTLLEK
ncbi:polysaccharide deacetylase family protein [Halobacillus shinanisalinarum]|uniref:Polysaccharide deacetylase family protein n=1 Tax=Halobacillus shinanisalinarum TaxID=2932258 RepID=A0ABY4H5K9_9BACI|nr:polysaccharide deacetylase family protein [Halobacillus shinanisalinarum]UOQ95448.1 polysaccharide deacetylase family protein [Halobacillus shinanisalinarum]